ncbi:hypothetical protein GWU81_02895 [Salmonella enterica]|nr:hypothetical protein [Salmonella enterica]
MPNSNNMIFDFTYRALLFRDDSDISRFLVSAVADASADEGNDFELTWHYQAAMAALLVERMRLRIEQMVALINPDQVANSTFREAQSEAMESQILEMYADDNISVSDSLTFMHELAQYARSYNLHELRLACLDAAEYITCGCQFIQQMKSVLKSINRHRIKTGEYARLEG